ncbi:MAG: DUF885 family protein [Actinobacteria bacterium]|uniref:Unannotated protein n=2 Tax=freshwater metagenome TaxID=449393 RepID=A0A6J6K137_9ZZZZ|nr:DUF885 family protein [Actinomycetota bacterium]
MTTHRSPIFALSDSYVEKSARLSPMASTYLGIADLNDQLDDFSIAGRAVEADLSRATLAELNKLEPIDEIDRVAKSVMQERLTSSLQLHDSFESHISFNVLTSPPADIRQVFEMMPKESAADFDNIAKRLLAVDKAHLSWVSTIDTLAKKGKTVAQRQIDGIAKQLESYADGGYAAMAKSFDPDGKYPAIHEAAKAAARSSAETATYLRGTYMALATPNDAVGAERYAAWARYYTGADLDLRATYEWGLADLAQITERMWRVAAKIKPDAKTLREVADYLDNAPEYKIHGKDAIIKKLLDFTQAAVTQLDGTHFDIDERMKFCDARIAPEGSASAPYYMSPSEDMSRPGTTWLPLLGKDEVSWWHLASTWYHEAVPGHHLQVATSVLERGRLSSFQRFGAWISGYGEGWALYAERFMDDLGAFDEPGIEMGFLSAQALRATRIVIDIGMHLGYTDENGRVWDAVSGREALMNKALLDEHHATSETDRYLGWPGQAISYKVGEREWIAARENAKKRLGSEFSLKKFHAHALKIGPMGLDTFGEELALWDGK